MERIKNSTAAEFRDENGFALADYPETVGDGLYVLLGLNEFGGWYYDAAEHRVANFKREAARDAAEAERTPLRETDGALRDLDARQPVGAFVLDGGCDGSLDILAPRGEQHVFAAHVEDGEWSALYETVGREFGKLFETGMTPAVALDWLMTETAFTVAEWAAVRGVPRNAVDQSRARARTALDGPDV